MRLEDKVNGASMDNLGGFRKVPIRNWRSEKPIWLPYAECLLKKVVIICSYKAACSQRDDLAVDFMWLGHSVLACSSDEISNLLLRQLVESLA